MKTSAATTLNASSSGMKLTKHNVSNFLNEDVLSVGLFEGMIAKDLDSYRAQNAMAKYSKRTNGMLFTSFVLWFLPIGLGFGHPLYLQSQKSKQIMVCAATATKVYLLELEKETSDWVLLAEFDRQQVEIEQQKSFPGHTTIEMHQENIHAKIESKLSAATYLNREIVNTLRQN